MNIKIDENKEYTLSEIIGLVKDTLDGVETAAGQDNLRYTPKDAYWLINDMIQYINRNVSGEFTLKQIRKDVYSVTHASKSAKQQAASKRLKSNIRQTSKYLQELRDSNNIPSYEEQKAGKV